MWAFVENRKINVIMDSMVFGIFIKGTIGLHLVGVKKVFSSLRTPITTRAIIDMKQ